MVEDNAVSQNCLRIHLSRCVVGQFVFRSHNTSIGRRKNRLTETIIVRVVFAGAAIRLTRAPAGENQKVIGEALIASGVDQLFRGWQASAEVIGKVRTGANRWQAVIRQMQSSVNFADILRARALP